MNNRILLCSLLTLCIMSFNACRKGEDDPFFSFHTRKDRVAGAWVVSNYTGEFNTDYSYPSKKTKTVVFVQNFGLVNYSQSTSDTAGTFVELKGKVSQANYYFYKNGKWSSVLEYYLYAPQAVGGFYISKTRYENDGTWEFQDKTDGMKKKESMLVKTENEKHFYYTYSTFLGTVVDSVADSSSVTYGIGEKSDVWKLIGLRTNRMKAEIVSEQSFISTVPGIAGTSITSTKKISIELN
ncbi:MAG: hypothetical protein IPP32_16800 [Bacteroidetes bacterium]|nr:hypothetical protein [Bacteroidota bacterium]